MHTFTSENLWFDPAEFNRNRREIGVRVVADRPERHRVDLSFLPTLA